MLFSIIHAASLLSPLLSHPLLYLSLSEIVISFLLLAPEFKLRFVRSSFCAEGEVSAFSREAQIINRRATKYSSKHKSLFQYYFSFFIIISYRFQHTHTINRWLHGNNMIFIFLYNILFIVSLMSPTFLPACTLLKDIVQILMIVLYRFFQTGPASLSTGILFIPL